MGSAFSRIISLSTALVSLVVYPPFFRVPSLHSHRIKELMLHFITQEMLTFLFQNPEGSFNHLENLHVKARNDYSWIDFPSCSSLVMPALKVLRVDSSGDDSLHPALSLPWTQLRELEVADAMEPYDILDILNHSPCLVRSTFQVWEEAGFDTHPPITLPHLTLLSLSHKYSFDVAAFLDPLILPSLEELHMTDNGLSAGKWSHQAFTALINRSQCIIQHLVLRPNRWARVRLREDSIEPLLRALPAVKMLVLPPVVPSSMFVVIRQNRLLSQLVLVRWMVDTAGAEGFTDWLLSFEAGGGHRLKWPAASCHVGRLEERRFYERKAEIAYIGISAALSRAGKGDDGSCNCEDLDTDGSEGDEDEDDDCPWS